MALNIHVKFEKKTDLCFQKWYNKFSKFSLEHIQKSKTWELCSYYELKFYRGVMCNENEEWCQIWRGIDLSVEIDMRSLTNFDLSTQKFQKFALLMGCFLPKYIMFELKRHREDFFYGTKYWCKIWRKTDLFFQKWHAKFCKFSPEHVGKFKNLNSYWVVLSNVENLWT